MRYKHTVDPDKEQTKCTGEKVIILEILANNAQSMNSCCPAFRPLFRC